MKEFALQQYGALQKELQGCQDSAGPFVEKIETGYRICNGYWHRLREQLRGHRFATTGEEVEFFKVIKPKFIAEIEYYNLLYHSELFKPVDPVDQLLFWEREARRLQKFREDHKAFVAYYERGHTDHDACYFTRTGGRTASPEQIIHDREGGASTSHDYHISSLKALERYNAYVLEQMKE